MKKIQFCAAIALFLLLPACSTIHLEHADMTSPDTAAVILPQADTIATALIIDSLALPDSLFNDTITIAAVGDIMMGSCYPTPLLPPNDGKNLFDDCREILKTADLALGNLEGPLCDEGKPAKTAKKGRAYVFRSPPSFAENLSQAGFDAMSLANNHANDFGASGNLSTQKTLDSFNIQYSGKEGNVAVFQVRGTSVAIIALAAGGPPRSIIYPYESLREIDSLSKVFDILVVSIHAGMEGRAALHLKDAPEKYLNEPRGHLIKFAHDAIDQGADLIIGHGPHVPRGLEIYKERLIAYSLGNFCTYGGINLNLESGYAPLLWAELDSRGKYLGFNIHSFLQTRPGGPTLDSLNRAAELIRRLSISDFPESHPYR